MKEKMERLKEVQKNETVGLDESIKYWKKEWKKKRKDWKRLISYEPASY